MGTEIFPDANAPLLRIRLARAAGTRIEETERIVLTRSGRDQPRSGTGQRRDHQRLLGVMPSSYPVDLIHLFTSGPQEAVIQVALKPDAPRGEALRERLRDGLRRELPATEVSFEAGRHRQPGDELRIADAGRSGGAGASLQDDYAYAQKVQTANGEA